METILQKADALKAKATELSNDWLRLFREAKRDGAPKSVLDELANAADLARDAAKEAEKSCDQISACQSVGDALVFA